MSFFENYSYLVNIYRIFFKLFQVNIETVPVEAMYPSPLEESVLESLYEEYLNPKPKEEIIVSRKKQSFYGQFVQKKIFFPNFVSFL